MVESVEPTTIITTLKSVLAVKSAGSSVWGLLAQFFGPDRLKVVIDAALRKAPSIIQPPPQLIRDRLTKEVAEQLLKQFIQSDEKELSEFLRGEQLVSLPQYPVDRPNDWDAVWCDVARAVQRGVSEAAIAEEPIFRQIMLLAMERGPELVAELNAIRNSMESIEKQLAELSAPSGKNQQQMFHVDSVATARIDSQLLDNIDELRIELRRELDEKVERLWCEIVEQIEQRNFRIAVKKGGELKADIENKHRPSGVVLGRTYLLLAQVALIESHETDELFADIQAAIKLFDTAKEAFGVEIDAENQQRIANFQAKLYAIAGENERAIAELGDARDPQTITTRLLIYIDMGSEVQAVESIRDEPLNVKWCEFAAFAMQRTGDDDDADRVLHWADDQGHYEASQRCRLAIAKAILLEVEANCGNQSLTPLSVSEIAKVKIARAKNVLTPLAAKCLSANRIENGVEADSVGFMYECCRLLNEQTQSRTYVKLLHARRPTHFGYAKAMIRGDIEYDAELPSQIREDYPGHFLAHDFALTLELHADSSPSDMLFKAEQLGRLGRTSDQKEKVARTIFQIATTLASNQIQKARDAAVRLVGENHYTVKSIDAYRWMRERDLEKFRAAVEEIDCDDYLKDQFRAQLLAEDGQYAEAAGILLRSAKRVCEPGLLREAAMLARHAKPPRLDIALEALEAAVLVDERHPETNALLADVYLKLHLFIPAAECFARLRDRNDEDWSHAFNQAFCYVYANQSDDALEIFSELCERPGVPLKAHLARSTLLVNTGDPKSAMASLEAICKQFWETPEFLMAFMNVAYAAGDDKSANSSFQKLLQLRNAGLVPDTLLKSGSTDDLIQLGRQAKENRNFLLDQSLAGKAPWIFCERLLGNTAFWGWRIRTQPIRWIFDDARGRASHSIYSTNGFAVVQDKKQRPRVTRLKVSPGGKPIVADFSALITLHRLGILESALSYFDHVKIPPSYSAMIGREIGELQPHQLSTKQNLKDIKQLVDSRQIKTLENTENDFVVDEYRQEADSSSLSIVDVLNGLRSAGKVSESQFREAKLVAHRSAILASDANLEPQTLIVVNGQTMQTIAGQDLLPIVCETFDVRITEEDFLAINQKLKAYEDMEETRLWNVELWNTLNSDDRVHLDVSIVSQPDKISSDSEGDEAIDPAEQTIPAIDASLLAQQEKLPLLADDRVCHAIIFQQNPDVATAAFSTDTLITGLVSNGNLDQKTAAHAYLKLMKWRYRFLVVPSDTLLVIAKEFAPVSLRKVAEYVHDCMRDPGLFGGAEKADPPLPIAYCFFQAWLVAIAEFTADVWLDGEIDESRTIELTEWAMRELVPTPPFILGSRVEVLSNFTPTTILVHAMMRLTQSREHELVNRGLRRIASGLGLSDQEFLRIATDIIDRND